jgi:predicted nucleotidyltransferase
MRRKDAVQDVVARLVEYYQPERIYLIGSTARGEDRPDSDLDFVVVLPDDAPREKVIGGEIHQRLRGIPAAVDVIPFRHSTFEARAAWLMSLPAIALREGKLEYDASAVAR